MNASPGHVWVVAPRRRDRRPAMAAEAPPDHLVSCHQRLRGPLTGATSLLAELVPQAFEARPDLVDAHRVMLLYVLPQLAASIGPGPQTLVDTTPHEERTRYFGHDYIRAMSQGVVTFLLAWAAWTSDQRGRPLCFGFDDVDAAESTDQEFLAILLRRAKPGVLRLVLAGAGDDLDDELALALRSARRVEPTPGPRGEADPPSAEEAGELAAAYVASDGTSDDPRELAAYRALADDVRTALHDRRADELEAGWDWGLRLGAIPYHRERGADPQGAGRRALRRALEYCVAKGYSSATVDLGLRGRALSDPEAHQQDYCHFSAKAANAMVPLGQFQACEQIYRDLMRTYSRPRVHMSSCYALAMLYTRFFVPRDHDRALELINTSRALASLETDPVEGAYLQVYQDNGAALVEMHRGRLQEALDLVTAGIERLDRELPHDRYLVHRSQLLHNRARVLVPLGRLDEAYADFSRLIERDPWYVEYHVDRANVSRRRGDLAGALADYDRAIAVSAPFPELFCNRADVRAEAGDVDGALADLAFVVEMEPAFVDAWLNHGALLLEGGDPDGAAADVVRGLGHAPDDPRLLCLLALAEQARGDLEAARAALDRALAAAPAHAPALVQRAVLAFESGQLDASIEDLTLALSAEGDDPDVLFNRGVAYRAAGRFDEALADFGRALGMRGCDTAALLFHRAECHVLAGSPEAAREDVEALLALGPSDFEDLGRALLVPAGAGS